MTAMRVAAASVGLALAFTSPTAHGQPRSGQASLEYRAGPGCPDEAAFRARVEARAPVAFDPRANRVLQVTLDAGEASRGRLLLTTEGAPVVRDVSGTTCDEVASALALIAAVLLEGGAVPEEPASQLQPAPAAGSATPSAPVAPPSPPAPPVPPTAPAEPFTEGPPVRVRFALGGQALLGGGVGPDVAVGGRAFGEASINVAARPSVRLSVAWYPGTDLETSGGPVHFSQLTGRFEICPIRLETGELSLSPCLALDAGSLRAGRSAPAGSEGAHVWLAPGALARVAWFFGPVVGLELEGGITVPLDRYRFFFTPEPLVYQVPKVTGSGGLGVVLRFP
jgi:hypothetical protein